MAAAAGAGGGPTPGAVHRLHDGTTAAAFQPVLHVLACGVDYSAPGHRQHTLTLSDGSVFVKGMVAVGGRLHQRLEDAGGQSMLHMLVRLEDWQATAEGGQGTLTVFDASVLGPAPYDFTAMRHLQEYQAAARPPPGAGPAPQTPARGGPCQATGAAGARESTPSPVLLNARAEGGGWPPAMASTSTAPGVGQGQGQLQPQPLLARGPQVLMPLKELTPYSGSRWKIQARVVTKTDIRKFRSGQREGQFFKVELCDASGAEMSATFFGKAVDMFFDMLQLSQVYYFTSGVVKPANRQYDRGDFTLTFDERSVIEPAPDDRGIPGLRYNFVAIAHIEALPAGSTVDVMAVVADAREPTTITTRASNEERPKRDLTLWDDSGEAGSSCIVATIWGNAALQEYPKGAMLLAKSARTAEFMGGKTLNVGATFCVEVAPRDERAAALQTRFQQRGADAALPTARAARVPTSGRQTVQECEEEDVALVSPPPPGQPPEPGRRFVHRHFVVGTFVGNLVERQPFYWSCPHLVERQGVQKPCQKKVERDSDCCRCELGHVCPRAAARYLCRAKLADATGTMEVTLFDEGGRQLFGVEANAFAALHDDPDPSAQAEMMRVVTAATSRRVQVRLRSAKEVWQESERTKVVAEEVSFVQPAQECRRLLGAVLGALGGQAAPPSQGAAQPPGQEFPPATAAQAPPRTDALFGAPPPASAGPPTPHFGGGGGGGGVLAGVDLWG